MPFTPSSSLLVTSDALEENLFDKATGLPLSGGIVTFYVDGTNTLKNIYQQNGVDGGPYTYTALPNPMTLNNADGSTSDSSGNNVKIYYYPYVEGVTPLTPQFYFVTVYNSAGTLQFTRSNFPFGAVPIQPTPGTTENAYNQIVNGRFWRNIATDPSTIDVSTPANQIVINGITNYYTTVAPSQHDGFAMPDIIFIKNGTASASSDVIKFGLFPQNPGSPVLTGDITPEYYLDFKCTATGTDTYKYIQIPISEHLLTLGGQPNCTVTFQAKAISGTNPTIAVNILPFAGTGATTPATVTWQTFNITSSWQKFTVTQTMPPSITESLLGVGGDDGFYLQLSLPAGSGGNATCELQIAVPSFYITNTVPTNDFETYDSINSVISSPRTGDIRHSMNNFTPFGWVPLNNLTIGSASSAATNRANRDTWPLYNLLYNSVNQAFVPVSGYTGNAYNDFNSNLPMQLTSALGQALIGLPISLSATYNHATTPSWNQGNYTGGASVAGLFTLTGGSTNTLLYPGAPVILSGAVPVSGAFTVGTVYYAVPDPTQSLKTGTTFQLASTYANAIKINPIAAVGVNDSAGLTVGFALGGNFGEGTHLPQIAELVTHSHLPTGTPSGGTPAFVVDKTTGTITLAGGGSNTSTQTSTANTGNSQLFNNVSPGLYTNVFIKL